MNEVPLPQQLRAELRIVAAALDNIANTVSQILVNQSTTLTTLLSEFREFRESASSPDENQIECGTSTPAPTATPGQISRQAVKFLLYRITHHQIVSSRDVESICFLNSSRMLKRRNSHALHRVNLTFFAIVSSIV